MLYKMTLITSKQQHFEEVKIVNVKWKYNILSSNKTHFTGENKTLLRWSEYKDSVLLVY